MEINAVNSPTMITFNNDRKKLGVLAAIAVTLIMLVVSVGAIGSAPFSIQQASDRQGPRITSANIEDETIVSADLKDEAAVRSSDIVEGQVGTGDLAPDAVTNDKIKDGEVTSADIKDGTVTSNDMAPGTIPTSTGTPADNSVTSAKIVDGEVRESDLQDNAVTTSKILDGAVTSEKISSSLMKHVVLTHDSNGVSKGWKTGSARHIIIDPDVHGTNSVVVANIVYPFNDFIGYSCFVTDLQEGSFRLDCNVDSPPGDMLSYLVINPL